jgi:hypothetical protein
MLWCATALLVPQPVKAAKLRQRRVGEQIRIRLVAHEYSLPRTTFGRSIESYVAELRPAHGHSSLARIYYRPMQFEPSMPLALLDYSAVHRFRAVRDSGCDATMEAISFSDISDRSGEIRRRKFTLEYLANAPELTVPGETVIPCYVIRPSDYQGTEAVSESLPRAKKMERSLKQERSGSEVGSAN